MTATATSTSTLMPPPASAGDALAFARHDPSPDGRQSGAIAIRPEAVSTPDVIAHELFHLVQRAIGSNLPRWLKESTAEWAAYTIAGPPVRLGYLRAPGTPLDCASADPRGCAGDPGGYRRWVFFEALAERFGPAAIHDVLARSAAPGDGDRGIDAIQAALAVRGTDVAGALADLAARLASGTFTMPGPRRAGPPGSPATSRRASPAPAIADQALTVDHAALAFTALRGTSARCAPATLELTIDGPAGVPFRAVLGGRGRAAEPLDGERGAGDRPVRVEYLHLRARPARDRQRRRCRRAVVRRAYTGPARRSRRPPTGRERAFRCPGHRTAAPLRPARAPAWSGDGPHVHDPVQRCLAALAAIDRDRSADARRAATCG